MRTFRVGGIQGLNLSFLTDAAIDPVFYGKNGQAAVVPVPDYTLSGTSPVTDGRIVYTGTWFTGSTITVNSFFSINFIGYGCQVTFTTGLQNGIAFVTLDGSPRLAIDTFAISAGSKTYSIITPNGGAHTVTFTYYGDINQSISNGLGGYGVSILGPVTNTVGTSVGANITPTLQNRGAWTTTTWTIKALSASTVSINGSGTYSTGTTVTNVIPGVNLIIGAGPLTTNDTATFTTTAAGITFTGFQVAPSTKIDSQYASVSIRADGTMFNPQDLTKFATVPLSNDDTDISAIQWICASWEENPLIPITSGKGLTGNTSLPDQSWVGSPATDVFSPLNLFITHDGFGTGYMGLAILPSGTNAQIYLNVPQGGYVRNVRFYAWHPELDPDVKVFHPLDDDDLLGQRVNCAEAVSYAMLERDPVREAMVSLTISGAIGSGADNQGSIWNLVRPYGLDDLVYDQLIKFVSSQKGDGATVPFINGALATLLGPGVQFSVQGLTPTTTRWILGTSRLGVDTYLGSKVVNALTAIINIPVAQLLSPPQTIQTVVETFRPLGVNIIYSWI